MELTPDWLANSKTPLFFYSRVLKDSTLVVGPFKTIHRKVKIRHYSDNEKFPTLNKTNHNTQTSQSPLLNLTRGVHDTS